MPLKPYIYLAIFSLLSLMTTSANSKIYKWVDENGHTHFSDKPPKGIKYQIQNLSNMNVTSMPKPKNLLSQQNTETGNDDKTNRCGQSLNKTQFYQQRKRLEQQLKNNQLSDQQFALALANLEKSYATKSSNC